MIQFFLNGINQYRLCQVSEQFLLSKKSISNNITVLTNDPAKSKDPMNFSSNFISNTTDVVNLYFHFLSSRLTSTTFIDDHEPSLTFFAPVTSFLTSHALANPLS